MRGAGNINQGLGAADPAANAVEQENAQPAQDVEALHPEQDGLEPQIEAAQPVNPPVQAESLNNQDAPIVQEIIPDGI